MENERITERECSGEGGSPTLTISKEPWLGVILSKFWPGIGQIYAGRIGRGCVLILVEATLLCFGWWCVLSFNGNIVTGVVVLMVLGAVRIWSLFDAHKCVRMSNSEEFELSRKDGKDPWLAVFLSSIIPGVGQVYIKKRPLGIVFILCSVVLLLMRKHWLVWVLGLGAVFVACVCYHAYASSPVRREGSKRLIVTVTGVMLVVRLLEYTAFPIREHVFEVFKVTGDAMGPTLLDKDRMLVWKFGSYNPKRGDIVVFKSPTEPNLTWVERLIAYGGESVEITDESIYINGQKTTCPVLGKIRYVSDGKVGVEGAPYVVPENSFYVLGDNSADSFDSRFFGAIPESDLIGRAYKIYWPPGRMGPIE